MSVKKRKDSGAYEVTVCVPGQPTVRKSNKEWTRRDAQLVEFHLRQPVSHTLDAAIDKWLDEYVGFLKSEKTTRAHCEALRTCTHGVTLAEAASAAAAMRKRMAKLAPATLDRRLAILRRVCRLAYTDWEWLDKPVHHKLKLLRVSNARHYYLTRAQVEGLAFACGNRAVGDLVVLAAFTGLRWSEMRRVEASHIRDGKLLLDARTKNGRPRSIPLHPRALHIALQMPIEIADVTVRRHWQRARKTMKLEHIHWHDLRHTFASWMLQHPVRASLVELKELMGHANIESTMRYAHLAPNSLQDAVMRL